MRKLLSFLLVMVISVTAIIALVPSVDAGAATIMSATEFADKCYEIATEYKTLYVMGCFGAPMNANNKQRYINNYSYNKQSARAKKINAASSDTFGFDCVCLIKGVLWGWNGNTGKTYGGANYASNGVSDMSINTMLSKCTDVSTNFSKVEVGEILFYKDSSGYSHVGIYIGNGLAVESTPIWDDGVQVTAVLNQGSKTGYNGRTWYSHGKLTSFLSYHTCTNFTGAGVCNSCGKTYDWQKTYTTSTAGTYKATRDFTPRTNAPYDEATKASSKVKIGSTVKVEGSYTNAFNHKWYKIIYDNNKVGYVFHESLQLTSYNSLNVSCTGFKPESNAVLPLGQGYPVYGTVSSNYPLKNVVAKIDGTQYATWTASNNTTTSFEIDPTNINHSLKFGNLSAGQHTITLIATDIYGRTQTFLTRTFYMGSASVGGSGIDDSNVFLKQQTNYTCTLVAATMMVRRTAILHGLDNWESITESSMRSKAWLEGTGLYHNFTYTHNGVAIKVTVKTNLTGDYAAKKAHLIEALQKYPQGVAIYNTSQPHAILLTKYDAATDTFYCADPSGAVAKGQIPISQSSLKGSGQEGKISAISMYWYVSSPTVSSTCSHSYSSTYSSNSDNHWKACTKCGATTSVATHSYSNTCDTSCNTCGYTRSINHTYSNDCDTSCNVCGATRSVSHNYEYMHDRLEDKTSTKHWRECTICGNKVDEESHTLVPVINSNGSHLAVAEGHYMGCHICDHAAKYPHVYDNDCDTLCNICNHKNSQREPNHSYSNSYSYDANSHWRYCVNCNEKTLINTHNYSNSCDATCDTCNYTRTTSHSYSNACDTSCNVCGATRSASHTYSNACDTSCNVCGASRGAISHEYDNACDTSCNICGAIRTTAHKYSNACDKSCDVCGAERTVPSHVYDHDCDTSCNNCGHSRPTSHTYDNNCDEKCNVCGATRTVSHSYTPYYLSDASKHWRQCNDCGHVGYSEGHVPGNPPTETTSQICIICNYVIQPATHTHNFSDEFRNNANQHWYECECGARKNSSNHDYKNDCDSNCDVCDYARNTDHVFDQGVVTKEPTTTEGGIITYTCTKCGENKYENLNPISGGNNPDPNNPGGGENQKDETSNNKPNDGALKLETGPVVAIVAVVVVATIVAIPVVVSLSKKPASVNPSLKTNFDIEGDENSKENGSEETNQ